jgi:alpha-glucosidase
MPSSSPWWRDAVIYQVYIRSFADGDGDGMGDFSGLRSRLAYLAELGVDAVWLNPFYPSPQADAGYDVADYRDVDPRFGTLTEFDAFMATAHDLGVRVIVDLVPNHTSNEHEWFQAALASPPGSRERARYIFRDGGGPKGELPPNNWASNFGGPAWTRVTEADGSPGQWYLHLFAPQQPDLDWMNPEVIEEFDSILRFWLDRGVDGFRIDVAHGLAKDPDLRNVTRQSPRGPAVEGHPHWDVDEVHDVYRGWRRVTDEYDHDPTFVGEVWVQSLRRLARYLRPDELHTAFNFNFLLAPWDATAMKGVIDETIEVLGEVGAPPTWVLSNHDVIRHVTRYGGGALGVRRARAAALLMLALPGGAYVYQGDELGLAEITDLPDEVRQDPVFLRTRGTKEAQIGRDGCRVPMPWSGDAPPFGFSANGATPWLPQPASWAALTAERQALDEDSMLTLYRTALRLRRELPALGEGPLSWLASTGDDVLAFARPPGFACVVNFGEAPVARPASVPADARVLLASAPFDDHGRIAGHGTVWFEVSG